MKAGTIGVVWCLISQMKSISIFWSVFIIAFLLLTAEARSQNSIKLPIVNGMASYLPKPIYPKDAEDFCAKGEVKVEVLIGKSRRVLSARAISGDEYLIQSAVLAAKKARFQQLMDVPSMKRRGILVYNFHAPRGCLNTELVVNKKALSIPKPFRPGDLKINEEMSVIVQIVIDESGKVISARAISGHPMLRAACVHSATGARFNPTYIDPGPVKVSARLLYKFKPNGEIEY
jgi:outer membrane biosynthesis protein TonB